MGISGKEVMDFLNGVVTKEVEEMLTFKHLKERLPEERYKNLVSSHVRHKIVSIGEMEMYNECKKLSFPNELIWFKEWNIESEDIEDYKKMITDKIPMEDWGIVEDNGKTYYIMYSL